MPQLTGVAFKVGATFVFTFMSVLVKLASAKFPTGEIVFARSFFGMVPILIVIACRGEVTTAFRTAHPFRHVTRILVGISSMFLGFASLSFISLPDATAIGYAMPIFGVAFAALILKEMVRVYRWTAVVVGLFGVIIILAPHLSIGAADGPDASASSIGAALALMAAVVSALAMVTTRRLTQTEAISTIVFYFSFGGAMVALMTLPLGWTWPSPIEALMLVGTGLLGGCAQILLTLSYKHADASVIAPFEYTSLLWSTLLGWWVFGDVPGSSVIFGSIIVIAAGLFVIFREHQLGLQRSRELQAGRVG